MQITIQVRLKYSSCCLVLLMLLSSKSFSQSLGKAQPNIIFILADDQGYGDLGSFFQNLRAKGHDAARPYHITPNLDRMAVEGARLTSYYCAAPICAPSRSSLMLGVSQGHANVRDNQFDKALEDNYTMPSTLRTLGYKTAAIGKWGLQGNDKYDINGYQWPAHPLKRGFDYYFGYMRHSDGHEHYPKEALYRKYWAENAKEVWWNYENVTPSLDHCYTTDLWTAAAKKYIRDHVASKDASRPFFLYLAFDAPHAVLELPAAPYPAGKGLKGGVQWIGKPGRFINTADGKPDSYTYPEYANAVYDDDKDPSTQPVPWPETYRRYATANRRIDDAVGDLLQLLKDLRIDDNTIVVYTSDNGPSKESYLPEDRYVPNKASFFRSYGPFEGIKGDNWEGGIHLPAIVRWPGKVPASSIIPTPVIAYDWAPTFIQLAGQQPPVRMDGVSLTAVLKKPSISLNRPVYIEYKNEEATPDYEDFSAVRRNRARNQMQFIRLGNIAGVRYDIHSASDPFEIYDIPQDPGQRNNLAIGESTMKNLNTDSIQAFFKARVMQMRHMNVSTPRPYDSAYIPAIAKQGLQQGVRKRIFKGNYPWIPNVHALVAASSESVAFPGISDNEKETGLVQVFDGYFSVPRDGKYSFYMACDARAFLRIHDIQLLDEDYAYPGNLLRTDSLFLKAGLHPFQLSYYRKENKGAAFLKLDWSGPALPRQRMPKNVFFINPLKSD